MPISVKTLQKYLVQIRRIEEHRSEKAQRNIIRLYKALRSDLRASIGEEYIKYSEDDVLKYEQLFKRGEYARFLEEVEQRINSIMSDEKKTIRDLVEETYKTSYIGMVEAVEKSKNLPELSKKLSSVKAVTPETIQRAVTNPISGLTLNDTLEKHRKEVIYEIKQQIGIGLSQGDRYTTMAKRIDDRLDIGYKKAMTITRTESHRVMEEGQLDSALEIDKVAKEADSDLIYVKIWRTMEDEKVRPQMKSTKNKGRHSRIGKPNHVKMEDTTLAVADKFDLGGGVTTDAPLMSGVAGHDINCRCYLEYDFLTAEEYFEKTGKVWEKPLTKDDDSGIMKVVVPTKIVSGHTPAPAKAYPHDIIDHLGVDGKTETRSFYDDNGNKSKDITNHNHGNQKQHPFGKNGEHAHDYEYDEKGYITDRKTREIMDKERKESGDIL